MSRLGGRRRTTVLAALTLLPTLMALLLVRPVGAQDAAFGLYALTFNASGAALDGEIGAGGGLAVLDSGVPFSRGRLDSSPSADVRSAAVEPGTLVRTVAGVVNTEAGEEVIPVYSADAQFPGNEEAQNDILGSETAGPLTLSGFTARSVARADEVTGRALMGEEILTDGGRARALSAALAPLRAAYPNLTEPAPANQAALVTVQQGLAQGSATADAAGGRITAVATGRVKQVDIAGEIILRDVVGTATVVVDTAGERVAEGHVTVGGATIAGVPVEITEDGVVAADQELLPGQTVRDLTAQLNGALEAANVSISVLAPKEEAGEGFAEAGSGGVRISIATPPNPQVPGNDLIFTFGRAEVTAADEPPFEPAPPIDLGSAPDVPPSDGGSGSSSSTGTSSGPSFSAPPSAGTASGGGDVAPPDPVVAEPATAPADQPMVMVAGRRVSAKTTLAAFGAWQLLSLSIVTMAAWSFKGSRG